MKYTAKLKGYEQAVGDDGNVANEFTFEILDESSNKVGEIEMTTVMEQEGESLEDMNIFTNDTFDPIEEDEVHPITEAFVDAIDSNLGSMKVEDIPDSGILFTFHVDEMSLS